MKKLHLLVLKSYIGPFFATFFITLFVLLMQFLFRYIEDLVGKGLSFNIILEFFYWVAFTLVPIAFPLAILLASIMTFGNLGENYELAALKASGISLFRIMKPLIVLHVLLFIGIIYYASYVVPMAQLKVYSLFYGIKYKNPEVEIKVGIFSDVGNYKIKVNKKDPETGMLYDIIIYNHSESKANRDITTAKRAKMKMSKATGNMIFTLYDGCTYTDEKAEKESDKKKMGHRKSEFAERSIVILIDQDEFEKTDERLLNNHRKMLNLGTLSKLSDSLTIKLSKSKLRYKKHLLKSEKIKFTTDTLRQDTISFAFNNLIAKINTKNIDNVFDIGNKSIRNQIQKIDNKNRTFDRENKTIIKLLIEWHKKLTFSFACLIFFFIGAPLGAIIRKGGLGTPVVISITFFIIYYAADLILKKTVSRGEIDPMIGMWLTSFILFPFGLFLTYKAVNDSVILDLSSNIKKVKNLYSKVENLTKNLLNKK